MRLLPRARREGMRALYAFCRLVDDIADEPGARETKIRLLKDWDEEIARVYEGRPVSAVGRALVDPVRAYGLPQEEFHLIVEGMRRDALGPVVAPTMEELRLYTRQVAGAVGLLSMHVFGAWRGEASRGFALALADALQLTNILRDVEEDAAMGRLYLPAELLDAHGIPRDPAAAAVHPALPALCAELGAAAQREFDVARALTARHELKPLTPALMMMGVYEAYLQAMRDNGFRRDRPPRLSRARKLAAGLGCALDSWRARLGG